MNDKLNESECSSKNLQIDESETYQGSKIEQQQSESQNLLIEVTRIENDSLKTTSLNQIYPDLVEALKAFQLKIEGYKKDIEKIRLYYNIVVHNKKQVQNSCLKAGLKRTVHSPGTNKGRSRLKYAVISGGRTMKMGAPSTVKGRTAFPIRGKQKNKKLNRKFKALCIKLLLYYTLTQSKLYVLSKDYLKDSQTSVFLRKLKSKDTSLAKYIAEPKNKGKSRLSPVFVLNEDYQKYFSNFNVFDLRRSTNYFGLYNGARFRKAMLFTEDDLRAVLEQVFDRVEGSVAKL